MLLIAAPVMADVVVKAVDKGGRIVEVNYVCTGSPAEKVRAFALDLELDTGKAQIVCFNQVSSFISGESNTAHLGYGIFPGRFRNQFTAGNPNWADPNYVPTAPEGDVDSNGTGLYRKKVILEMGTLYVESNAPPSSGVLCQLKVDPNGIGNSDCNLAIAANTVRGKVVLEDGTSITPSFTGSSTKVVLSTDCFPSGYTTYGDWQTYKKPSCWCAAPNGSGYQCLGDADGITSGAPFQYRVYLGDASLITTNWKKKITDTTLNPCADVDHKSSGAPFQYRVYLGDATRLTNNWKKKDSNLGIPGPCPTAE